MSPYQLVDLGNLVSVYYRRWSEGDDEAGKGEGPVTRFFVAMLAHPPFWEMLQRWQSEQGVDLSVDRFREVLVQMSAEPEADPATLFVQLGLDGEESAVLLQGLRVLVPRGVAIRQAFAAGSPEKIARALETLMARPSRRTMIGRMKEFFAPPRAGTARLGTVFAAGVLVAFGACSDTTTKEPAAQGPVERQTASDGSLKKALPGDLGAKNADDPAPTPDDEQRRMNLTVPLYKGVSPDDDGPTRI